MAHVTPVHRKPWSSGPKAERLSFKRVGKLASQIAWKIAKRSQRKSSIRLFNKEKDFDQSRMMQCQLKSRTCLRRCGFQIGARGRNRTGTTVKSRDFKSLVSTDFTTRAERSVRQHHLFLTPSLREEAEKNQQAGILCQMYPHFAAPSKDGVKQTAMLVL